MGSSKQAGPDEVVRQVFKAFETKDRAAIDSLLGEDLRFTSPLDNGIDRATYFKKCWPNSANIDKFELLKVGVDGETVFVTYEAVAGGRRFQNTEVHTVRNGKVREVEVYFGWSIPHEVAEGKHQDPH